MWDEIEYFPRSHDDSWDRWLSYIHSLYPVLIFLFQKLTNSKKIGRNETNRRVIIFTFLEAIYSHPLYIYTSSPLFLNRDHQNLIIFGTLHIIRIYPILPIIIMMILTQNDEHTSLIITSLKPSRNPTNAHIIEAHTTNRDSKTRECIIINCFFIIINFSSIV